MQSFNKIGTCIGFSFGLLCSVLSMLIYRVKSCQVSNEYAIIVKNMYQNLQGCDSFSVDSAVCLWKIAIPLGRAYNVSLPRLGHFLRDNHLHFIYSLHAKFYKPRKSQQNG